MSIDLVSWENLGVVATPDLHITLQPSPYSCFCGHSHLTESVKLVFVSHSMMNCDICEFGHYSLRWPNTFLSLGKKNPQKQKETQINSSCPLNTIVLKNEV